MSIELDHFIVPARNQVEAAQRLAQLLGVPWAEKTLGPFSAVYVNDGLTLDFIQTDEDFPVEHFCFRVSEQKFDAILARLQAAGISYRSDVRGAVDHKINTAYGGRMVYWNEPEGHQWEMLTVSYARPAKAQAGSHATERRSALGLVTLVVRDYDEALAFYVDVLGFGLVEDTEIPAQGKRWVVVSPGGAGARLLLAKASSEEQAARVGTQTGGRVFLFLYTDDCLREHARLQARGVKFVRQPEQQTHGLVAVFEDLYGNLWDLIEPNAANRSWPW